MRGSIKSTRTRRIESARAAAQLSLRESLPTSRINMAGGPPQSVGISGVIGVNVGFGVRVTVEVGVIEAVGVTIGELILFRAPQAINAGRSIIQSNRIIPLKR